MGFGLQVEMSTESNIGTVQFADRVAMVKRLDDVETRQVLGLQ